MNDKLGIKGSLTIKKYKKEKLLEHYYYENLITDVGLDFLLKLIGNDITGGINKLALGTGTNPANKSDIALQNKIILLDVQKDYSISGVINFMVNIPENTFSQIVAYTEAGLVCKTVTSETLITRLVLPSAVFQKPENSISFLYSLELRM